MKKIFGYIVVLSTMLSACTADLEEHNVVVDNNNSAKIVNGSAGCVEGSMIVCFNTSAESRLAECATRSGATRTGIQSIDMLLDEVKGYSVKPLFVVTDKNREKVHKMGLHLWYELYFDADSNIDNVATRLADVAEVEAVQFVHRVCRLDTPKSIEGDIEPILPKTRGASDVIPFNDVYTPYQWSLNNLGSRSKVKVRNAVQGQVAPVAGADINVVPAWKLCKGDPSIVVAIVDEGIMHSHEDLADNMWVNTAELNGQSGVDDDENGYKDDIYGYNFVFLTGEISWNKKGDQGHGSHVAGIVSAVNNNGVGISGIAGGSGNKDGVRLMSVQIFSGDSGSTTTSLAKSMQYAADQGAHILQCSWGYLSAEAPGVSYRDRGPGNDRNYNNVCAAEARAIEYFIANGGTEDGPIEGGLVIFASGNETAPRPCYPSAYKPCISVTSFGPALRPAYYTNFGIGSDIAAPGGETTYDHGGIFSTVPTEHATSGTQFYAMQQGTSQACPHVSGVAALGLSYAKQLGKRFKAEELRSMLISATNSIEPFLTGEMSYPAYDIYVNYADYVGLMGVGYIDAYRFLLQIDGTPCHVVKVGEESEIDLSLYFGNGIANAQFVQAEASAEDSAAAGLTIGDYVDGKLKLTCANSGAATITVTMRVGGGSLTDSSKPYPTDVTRTFVVISKLHGTSSNGGWL